MPSGQRLQIEDIMSRYERSLLIAASRLKSSTTSASKYIKEFYKFANNEVQKLKKDVKTYVNEELDTAKMKPSSFAILKAAGATYESANVKQTTYVQIVTALAGAANGFKDEINDYIKQGEKAGEVRTIGDLQTHIKERLESGGALNVEYSNGAKMPAAKYADMVSRTARIETGNIAMLGKALDDGNDLVECSGEPSTCPLCAVYQNRIYSISGKTKGYPALYETAFKSGYSIIHPNCRHQFFPYDVRFHTEAEREQLEKDTQRSWKPDTENRHFQQTEAAAAKYAKSQAQMRQWNKELNEYTDYKLYCEENGIEPKYKTLGGFRRAYRANKGSEAYKNSHYWRG